MRQEKHHAIRPEHVVHVKGKDQLAEKLVELAKKFEASGRRLTDESGKIKAMAFVGGVWKPNSKA